MPKATQVLKITTGFVTQVWDIKKECWVSQEFTAGECEYETNRQNTHGNFLDNKGGVADDPCDLLPCPEPYLPFYMVQPGNETSIAKGALEIILQDSNLCKQFCKALGCTAKELEKAARTLPDSL